ARSSPSHSTVWVVRPSWRGRSSSSCVWTRATKTRRAHPGNSTRSSELTPRGCRSRPASSRRRLRLEQGSNPTGSAACCVQRGLRPHRVRVAPGGVLVDAQDGHRVQRHDVYRTRGLVRCPHLVQEWVERTL